MKNLLVFLSPQKEFSTDEYRTLIKIQIDNHHRLGLPKDDFLLVTNFPYEYNGVKAILTKDEHWCAVRPRSIKSSIIPALVDEGIIKEGEIYWNHDTDAFQLYPISNEELELDGFDAGLTDYGWRSRLCMGSFFVKASSRDMFELVKPVIFSNVEDEDAMMQVNGGLEGTRWKRMSITYNLGMRHVPDNIERATRPVKVAHFHPRKPGLTDVFRPILPEEFIKILNQHGYK